MCRNRRDRRDPNKIVVHITAQVFEGLPFVSRQSVMDILSGIISRGQTLFPIAIVAFLFMGNHPHWILAGHGNRISPFMNYVQGEIAKAFKKLAPAKYEHKFWIKRFSEQRLYTPESVIEKLIYIFLNPLKAGLVNKVNDYPGLSSRKSFLTGLPTSELCRWTPSRLLRKLPNQYSKCTDFEEVKHLIKNTEGWHDLVVDPFAWLSCFGLQSQKQIIHEKLLRILKEQEEKYRGQLCLGKEGLVSQALHKPFKPNKSGRTPYIICHDKLMRMQLINSYREFCRKCREAWRLLRQSIAVAWPIGAYQPYQGWKPLRI